METNCSQQTTGNVTVLNCIEVTLNDPNYGYVTDVQR
jgi:hypothetical protein